MATIAMISAFDRGQLRPTETKFTTVRELLGIIGKAGRTQGLKRERKAAGQSQVRALPPQAEHKDAEGEDVVRMTDATTAEMHGRMGEASWLSPMRTVFCNQDARPGYETQKAHEYW